MLPILAFLTASAALSRGATLWPPIDLYPASALEERRQGQVTARIASDSNDVLSCTVSSEVDNRDLRAATCSLILARAAALPINPGEVMEVKVSWYIPNQLSSTNFDGAIPFDPRSWVLPTDIPPEDYPLRGSSRTEVSFDVATDGSVTACRTMTSSGSPELDERVCALITERASFLPALDSSGSPRIAHATTAITWYSMP